MQNFSEFPAHQAFFRYRDKSQSFPELIASFIKEIDSQQFAARSEIVLRGKIAELIKNGHFGEAIWSLMELRDLKQKIFQYKIPVHKNNITGHDILVRDARNALPLTESPEAYVIQALNYIRASLALLKSHHITAVCFENDLTHLACAFFEKVQTLDIKKVLASFEQFNSILITNLAQLLQKSVEETHKILSIAKDFANLEDICQDVLTIIQLKDSKGLTQTGFMGEIALTNLTDELKDEYINRKNKKWYQVLPLYQQKLIDYYLNNILAENRILPTQLRGILIGLRNSYHSIHFILKNLQEILIANDTARSGAIVYLGKNSKENLRISKLQVKQLQQNLNAINLLTITLNSNVNPKPNSKDKEIVENSQLALKAMGALHANIPLNSLRRVNKNTNIGINDYLKKIAKEIVPELCSEYNKLKSFNISSNFFSELQRYLSNNDILVGIEDIYYQELLTQLNELKRIFQQKSILFAENERCDDFCNIIELGLKTRFLSNNNSSFIDPENRNLQIATNMNLIATLLRKYYPNDYISSCCESGKDRTGILHFKISVSSFTKILLGYYDLISSNQEENEIIRINIIHIANSGHQQFLAGIPGCTLGAFGFKKDSEGALPEKEFPTETRKILILETASYNKKIKAKFDHIASYFYFLSFDGSSIERQKALIRMALTPRKASLLLTSQSSEKVFANFFKSPCIAKQRLGTIGGLEEDLTKSMCLEEIETAVKQCSLFNKSFTTGLTVHQAGDTDELLKAIFYHLKYLQHGSVNLGMDRE